MKNSFHPTRVFLVCTVVFSVLSSCSSSTPFDIASSRNVELEPRDQNVLEFQEVAVSIEQGTLLLTLEDAIERALVANRGLLTAGERVDVSRLSLVSAESQFELKFKPNANVGFGKHSTNGVEEKYGAGLTMDKRFESGTSLAITPRVDRVDGGFQSGVDVSLRQPLFLGSDTEYNLSSVDGAKFSLRTSNRSLFLSRVHTIVTTVSLVYRVVQQTELVALYELSLQRLRGRGDQGKRKNRHRNAH